MAKKENPREISDKDFAALPKDLQDKIRAADAAQNPDFQKPSAPAPVTPKQNRISETDTSPSVSSGGGLSPTSSQQKTAPIQTPTPPEPKQKGYGDLFHEKLKADVISKNKSNSIGPINPTSGDVIKEGAKQGFKNLASSVGNKAFGTAFPSLSRVLNNSGIGNSGGGGSSDNSARESTDTRQANNSIANQVSISNQILNNMVTLQNTTNTLLNELIKEVKGLKAAGGAGGAGGSGSLLGDAAGAVLDHLGGGGGKAAPSGVKPKISMLGKAGNLAKGAGNLLWKAKGGLGALAGGLALDYASDKLTESGHEKLGAGAGIASDALAGAGTGAMLGSVVPGVGTAIGGAVGGAIGGAYGLYKNWDTLFGDSKTEMKIADQPWKKGEELNAKQLMAVKLQVSMDPTGSKINPDVLEQFMKQIGKGASGPSASADIKDAQQVSSSGNSAPGSPGASADIKDAQKTSSPSAAAGGASPAAAGSSSSTTGGAGGASGASSSAATPYSGPGVSATGSAKEAIDYFTGKGWTKAQAIGIAANLEVESSFKTNAVGDGGKAYGIAQWHPDRQAEFKKKYNKDIREATFQEQLDFVNHELTSGSERIAGAKIKEAKSASDAAAAVDQYYERSDGKARQSRMNIATKYEKGEGSDATKTGGTSSEAQYDAMGNVTVPAVGAPSSPAASTSASASPSGGATGAGAASTSASASPSAGAASTSASASPSGGATGAGADASKEEGKEIGSIPSGDLVAAGKALQGMGINISENPAFGGVTKGAHARGSAHYEGKAIDLNGPPGMIEANDPVWGPKFDQVAKQMRSAGYRVLWRTAGHFNHLHAQLDGGKATGMGTAGQNSAAATSASLTPNEAAAIKTASIASKGAELSKASSSDIMDQRSAKTSISASQPSVPLPPKRPGPEPKFGPGNVGNLEPVDARARFKELFGLHA